MHIIIDGYNLIRHSPELAALDRSDLQLGREALVELLAAYKRVKAHTITVVFDGSDEPSLYGSRDHAKGIAIRYSAGGESADDLIRRMVNREKGRALVVSSDRAVQAAAESAGATAMTAADFEKRLAMARSLAMAGPGEAEEPVGWVPTTRKKGPSHRLPKRQRQARAKRNQL